ncbi:uncharacterized protein METZ01_LOCUS173301 [marine metagenome]|jgi:hypothetical protein|uniref:Uncharacterized protein n=1 Tax=marine metagenome TaxID=408172 RepID=A0A382C4U3_9ZZZZ
MSGKYPDLLTAIDVIEYMITAKEQQIKDEPNEPMWKDELSQLLKVSGLLDMEKESWEEESE